MNNLILTIKERGGNEHQFCFELDQIETYEALANRIDTETSLDGVAVVETAFTDLVPAQLSSAIDNQRLKCPQVVVNKTCVQVNYETESSEKYFPEQAPWSVVHRWACKAFNVAHDLCGNLELHAGEPDGPALNERKAIGEHDDCVNVWLVKPGAEPNGCG